MPITLIGIIVSTYRILCSDQCYSRKYESSNSCLISKQKHFIYTITRGKKKSYFLRKQLLFSFEEKDCVSFKKSITKCLEFVCR